MSHQGKCHDSNIAESSLIEDIWVRIKPISATRHRKTKSKLDSLIARRISVEPKKLQTFSEKYLSA